MKHSDRPEQDDVHVDRDGKPIGKEPHTLLQPAVKTEAHPTKNPTRSPNTIKHEKPLWEQYGYPNAESFYKRHPHLRPKGKRKRR